METKFTQEQKYILTKKRVEKISKFYKHLAVYIVVNIFLTVIFVVGDVNDGDSFNDAIFNYHNYKIWLYWGIGVVFQALNVFTINALFDKNWEEKKIKEYMNEHKS
ncbi:MAG: 2TM domain-containing protein [Polaribacter sp.]|nr:2TM domain-containing protein [Polaribacter sp.]